MTPLDLDLQIAVESSAVPDPAAFKRWTETALAEVAESRNSLSIRVVDDEEIRQLNREYRGKDKPTNVLSFPFDSIPGVESDYLGDIAVCESVVLREATDQHKAPEAHWAHMVVHGVLHLCGYDHVDEAEARAMEALEVSILAKLDLADPYA